MNNVPRNMQYAKRYTSIENPTLAHFRHFSSLFTPSHLYICREHSTNQLLFMQNKPNFKDAQINVNSYMKSKYEILDIWLSGKNKPNSNPILSAVGGFQKAKIAFRKNRPHPRTRSLTFRWSSHSIIPCLIGRTMLCNDGSF